jgi:anti-sigma regulatory factor (Ser/Thr protein kinase)
MVTWSRSFRGRPEQIAQARQFVALVLGARPVVDLAELVVSELATNAVRYSCSGLLDGWFVVSVDLDPPDRVQVSVTDLGGDGDPVVMSATRDAEFGRGLALVERVAKEWGSEPTDLGRRVWADLGLDDES